MANEVINVLDGDHRGNYNVLFLFAIAAPKQVGGANVVDTPASTLPPLAALILPAGEKAALDAGTLAFGLHSFYKQAGLTNPQQIAQLREIYATQKAKYSASYDARYLHVGARISES